VTITDQPRVLREYALIADGERGGLIAPDGSIVWLCAPRWDSPAAFAALLGGPGRYAVTPADPWYVWGGYYEPGTLIWHSRWTGEVRTECREALAMPADPHRVVLLRRIEAVDGPARVHVALDLRSGFGRSRMSELSRSKGCWTGRSGPLRFRWSGAARAKPDDRCGLTTSLQVAEGAWHDLVLEISDRDLPDSPPDPEAEWQATQQQWSSAVPSCDDLIAARDARHAYAVLRGLTAGTGAMVAAATTSLPERLEARLNYDYRYAWIRDQCYAGLAFAAHGGHPMLDASVRFVAERILSDGPGLRPAYTVTGRPVPPERSLRPRGYPGAAARAGNHVFAQFQLDVFGEALQLLAAAARLDRLDATGWRAAETAVAAIEQRWSEPDAGIWELNDEQWTHSRLACVAGLRAAAAAAQGPLGGNGRRQAAKWSALADTILAGLGDCVHPSGRWQRSPTDKRPDAALLLPAVRGAVAVDDPRSQATFSAVRDELTDDGYVYRFQHDSRPLHRTEGAFLLCGYWMALACCAGGDLPEARDWFERNRSACGPAALYTEEYDVHQRQLRGNLPQAFVHAALLETAARLSAAREATP
jgi:alpha,alpha-trehalase